MRLRHLLVGATGIAAVLLPFPPASLGRSQGTPSRVIATVRGDVIAVTQAGGTVAWLEAGTSGCRLRVRSLAGGVARSVQYARGCLAGEHDLALAGARAAWGGYEEVRCSETYAAVYASGGSRTRLVEQIPGDCLGYGTSYQGLASDGTAFFYSLLVTRPKPVSSRCGEGGSCRWRLAGGRIVGLAGSRPVTVHGLPAAALLAAAGGRIALVEPAQAGSSSGRGAFDWPRAARNGKVEIRDTRTTRIVSLFRPRGTVRAVALSASRAAVLVENQDRLRIEWYDSGSGALLGAAAVPRATAPRLSTDGRFAAFAGARTVRVLDLETGSQRIVRHATSAPVGLSVRSGRLMWAENEGSTARVLTSPA